MKPSRFLPAALSLLVVFSFAFRLPAADATPAPAGEPYELPKVEVKARLVCSFGIGVAAAWSEKTQSITRVFVESVAPGSDADTFGLTRGDEILAINGKKISTMKGGIGRGSDLFELLVNQPPGKKIDIEVAVRTVKRVSLTATSF